MRLAIAIHNARAWDRHFAENRAHGQIVLAFAVLRLSAGRAVPVRLQAFGNLAFDDHPLDLAQDRFTFGQCQPQRFHLEFGPLQGCDLVHLLLPVVGDGDNANLEIHAAASWPMTRNFRLISRRSQRRG